MEKPRSRTDPPCIGLIGVTGYARIYLDYLLPAHEAGKLVLVAAVVIPDNQNLPIVEELRQRNVRVYSSFEEMLEAESGRVDIYFIPTGIHWHARMAISSLRAGANVLVEKPLAGSVADAQQVMQVEAETGRWVAVGFQDIYAKETAELKEALVSGAIGRIRSVSMIGLWPRGDSYYARNNWAGRLAVDGAAAMDSPLNNAFAHFVNLALFLAGPSEGESIDAEVRSSELYRAHEIESFDTAVVTAESAQGTRFWFGVSHACRELRQPEIRIVGEMGEVEWLFEEAWTLRGNSGSFIQTPLPDSHEVRRRMFDSVLARLDNPSVPICDTKVALAHSRLIEAVHRSGLIRSAPASRIVTIPLDEGAGEHQAIEGIEDAIKRAFDSCATLSQTGFPGPD